MKNIKIALIAAVVLLSSCTTNMGKFAMLSTQDVDLKKQYNKLDPVEGTYTVHIISFVPTSFGTTPLYAEAAKDAMAKSGADFLENADVETTFFYIPLIYGQMTATVKGLAYKAK